MPRIPTLDGWRAVAILMVLFSHTLLGMQANVPKWVTFGAHGVAIFFVLSGYLITSRLLAGELANLRRFYIRRAFRLWPCAWTFLLCWVIIGFAVRRKLVFHPIDLAGCLLFFRNFLSTHSGNTNFTGHFWSLSIEEQFYLGWPVMLLMLRRKRALSAAILGACAVAIFRLHNWAAYANGDRMFRSEVHIDSLLVGCALALLLDDRRARAFMSRFTKFLFIPAACVFCFYVRAFSDSAMAPLGESVTIAILLASTVLHPESRVSRLLESKALVSIGLLSYSLYVWQQPFLINNWGIFTIPAMLLMVVVTFASYRWVETPGRRFGRRMEARLVGGKAPAATEIQPIAGSVVDAAN